jgi:superfamily I DNA and RNA helicase
MKKIEKLYKEVVVLYKQSDDLEDKINDISYSINKVIYDNKAERGICIEYENVLNDGVVFKIKPIGDYITLTEARDMANHIIDLTNEVESDDK